MHGVRDGLVARQSTQRALVSPLVQGSLQLLIQHGDDLLRKKCAQRVLAQRAARCSWSGVRSKAVRKWWDPKTIHAPRAKVVNLLGPDHSKQLSFLSTPAYELSCLLPWDACPRITRTSTLLHCDDPRQ